MFRDSLSKFFKVDSIIENLTGYVETRVELLKVEAKEEVAKGVSNLVVYALLAFVFALVLVFISVAIALKIGESLGSFAGFGIVGAIYLVAGVVLAFYRQTLISNIEHRVSVILNQKKKKEYGTVRNR